MQRWINFFFFSTTIDPTFILFYSILWERGSEEIQKKIEGN